jgi:small subunit ribosomal protein S17e
MGRIKTQLVKRTTLTLYKEHKDKFKKDFTENKSIVEEYVEFPSKKIKNTVAGYITRLVKSNAEV